MSGTTAGSLAGRLSRLFVLSGISGEDDQETCNGQYRIRTIIWAVGWAEAEVS